ncbi:MAG TPA: FG-GAP-like repeat-containing protein [Pyrinomonadaceae bacterium]
MKASFFCARASLSVIFSILITITAFSQDSDLRNDLHRSFSRFDVMRITPGNELRSEGEVKTLTVRSDGASYELVVTPNDLRASSYRAQDTNGFGTTDVAPPRVLTYKGKIAGEPGSEVRLTIDGLKVEGFFERAGRGRRFIEPAARYSAHAAPGDSVVYRAEDSVRKDDTFFCESDLPTKIDFGQEFVDTQRAESTMLVRILELATEADLEWVTTHGGATQANAEILSILNMVEGTYNSEINLSIQVVFQHTWSSADPYGAVDMPGMLTSFVNYWNANFGNVGRDATHLFSGKSGALSRGLAYVGVVCRIPSFSYGMSGYIGWAPGKFLIPAHELGHNLGADHAEAAQNCANSLMNAALSNSTPLSFCEFSRNVITTYVSTNSSCLTETPTTPPAATGAPFDFDGDARSDISVFRPSSGVWYLSRSGAGFTAFQFGLPGDKPVAADYDGDGRSDPAVFRGGVWYRFMSSTNTTDAIGFGLPGDTPVPADLDGDNRADLVIFRPSEGVWYSLRSSGSTSVVRFGLAGDVPVPADYDGDGRDDINLFRPSTGTWYRLNSADGGFFAANFGLAGDMPLNGDFDGDSKADIAVWRPSTGVWYVLRSSTGSFSAARFGLAGDIPAPADFDGDGKTDISVFRPSNGVWYRLNSGNGAFAAAAFGSNGDNPVPSYYIQ